MGNLHAGYFTQEAEEHIPPLNVQSHKNKDAAHAQ